MEGLKPQKKKVRITATRMCVVALRPNRKYLFVGTFIGFPYIWLAIGVSCAIILLSYAFWYLIITQFNYGYHAYQFAQVNCDWL